MINSPKFQLWLRIETGRIAVTEDNLANFQIPNSEIKIEIRQGNRWVEVPASVLT